MKPGVLYGLGLVFQAVFFVSVFDVYFQSPLVQHVPLIPPEPDMPPPAKRLVLFVADGLRADRFFELVGEADGASRAPFLRAIIERHGAWGVSHTRVPTESRPGHVALLAGFYEDVSAITRGWRHNPVPFDSMLHRVRASYSFGSPDIVPLFTAGVASAHSACYEADLVDFAAADTSVLDAWVFDRVRTLLGSESEAAALNGSQALFFLHLLALDTAGHASRPHSPQYLANIAAVDAGVAATVAAFEARFGDSATAYVFTSDHGMSAKGSHGDGAPENTRTPLVTWGAGIRAPTRLTARQMIAEAERDDGERWGLAHLARTDIDQADVAPLMAALLGTAFPANSVGRLPTELLNLSPAQLLRAARTHALQIYAQYARLAAELRERMLIYRPFVPLLFAQRSLAQLDRLVAEGQTDQALAHARDLADIAVEGLGFLHAANVALLMGLVVAGYALFACYAAVRVVQVFAGAEPGAPDDTLDDAHSREARRLYRLLVHGLTAVAAALLAGVLAAEGHPWRYGCYAAFTLLWANRLACAALGATLDRLVTRSDNAALVRGVVWLALTALALEAVVRGYDRREWFAVLMACAAAWPFADGTAARAHTGDCVMWVSACLALALCCAAPLDLAPNPRLGLAAAAAWLAAAASAAWRARRDPEPETRAFALLGALLGAAAACVWHIDASLARAAGAPAAVQTACWALLAAAPAVALVAAPRRDARARFWALALGCAVPGTLLAVHVESAALLAFAAALDAWCALEAAAESAAAGGDGAGAPAAGVRTIGARDVRRALLALLLANVSFFASGNVASVASFDLAAAFRFVTRFAPFTMAALLIAKLVLPLALLAYALGVQRARARLPAMASLLAGTVLAAALTLRFFLRVRVAGSWREIGSSVTALAIQGSFALLLGLLHALAAVLAPPARADSKAD